MPNEGTLKFVTTGMVELRPSPHRSTSGTQGRVGTQEAERLHAEAVKRILDRDTGELVGWLYRWNTGALCPRWRSEPREHVIYD